MSDINPKKVKIEIKGRTYFLRMNLLVADQLQEEFDASLNDIITEKLSDPKNGFKNLAKIIRIMVNDYIDEYNEEHKDKLEEVTDKWIGRNISAISQEIGTAVLETIIISMPETNGTETP